MKKLLSTLLLSASIISPSITFAGAGAINVEKVEIKTPSAKDLKEIDELLDAWHPKTGTVKENDLVWCVSNDWKYRDVMYKKMNGVGDTFSKSTPLGDIGARWFCFFKK